MEPIEYAARLREFYRPSRVPAVQVRAFDANQQRSILRDALHALKSVTRGGEIIDLSYEWGEEFAMNLGSGYRAKNS